MEDMNRFVPIGDLDKTMFSVQVASVGRKAQKLSKALAAVFILTAEDIRRSGATCTAEAPGSLPGGVLFDARLAWPPTRNGEFSVTARNAAAGASWRGRNDFEASRACELSHP